MKKVLFSAIIVLAAIVSIFIWINATSHNTGNAAANYKNYCASCHGDQLKTFIDRKWVYGNSWNEVFKAIKYGYPEDGMPAYDTTFTNEEIEDLTSYILNGLESLTKEDFKEKPDWTGDIQSEELQFRLETVVSDIGIPWGLAFLPNNDILITERSGKFYLHQEGKALQTIANVPEVVNRGQGGLLDVEVHPNFSENNYIYIAYSRPQNGKATTAIMRAKLQGTTLSNKKIIFEASPYLGTRHHYGCRMEFDQEGYLFLSVGDRGKRDQNPQSLKNHCGKIHRIYDDGRIPEDNPFVEVNGAATSIYSYGHRNPQGLTLDPETGLLWETEHGPRGGDEVNIIQKGANFGWPVISYGINYSGTKFTDLTEKEGMLQPVSYWVPSIGACGLSFVTGDKYPAWKGNLLAGSLSFEYIARLVIEDQKVVREEKLLKNIGRIRDIKMGNDGYIYFSAEDPGRVFRIVPLK